MTVSGQAASEIAARVTGHARFIQSG
jgi:hypothetical protein